MNNKSVKKNKILLFVSLILFAYSVLIFAVCACSERFANLYSGYVSAPLRSLMSFVTGWFEFSLFEWLLYLLPVLLTVVIVLVLVKKISIKRCISAVCLVLSALAFLFVNTFAVCYFCSPLEKRMAIDRKSIDRQELYNSSCVVLDKLETTLDEIEFANDGSSVMSHDWKSMCGMIDKGFDSIRKDYPFISDSNSVAKKITASEIMTYTHLSGIFMPLTGEANVNTNYPDYVVAFSIAHEKAHQRGIAGEDEANFVAFLALVNSGEPYLEYSGYLSMYDYFLESMYKYDKEMYYYMIEKCDRRVIGEFYAYSVFFDKYRNSAASEVADSVNNSYIKAMGDSKGVESYGTVVELFSAYIKKKSLP